MPKVKINKVLVANRGEIAIRIFRACYDLGINTVAMYSNEDTYALFRVQADEAYLLGENRSPLGTYLDIPGIIDLAKRRGVTAIHPGYGFLSENAEFARACKQNGIIFIGPPPEVLAMMGDKLSAKELAITCEIPTIPGCRNPLKDAAEAKAKAVEFGFPVILKAAGGGGGRGMRRCDTLEEVEEAFELVSSEARKAFGNEDIFMEKYLVEPKHIEVQILADDYGNVMHLGERDCSLQRRYQKVVEMAPAWSIPVRTVAALRADAVKIAKKVGYVNAGTVEFLVDRDGNHYFIEMNPRIQVEHTVTELVTGIDIVRAQILIAEGEPLSHPEIGLSSQEDLRINGFAVQCRVTTEDPKNNFAPDTGKITAYRSCGGFGVRLDGGNADVGTEISPYYDSLLVKVTCWDTTFPALCRKATRAINEVHVRGVKTNIPFVTNILTHPKFLEGGCHTKFIDETPELFDFDDSVDRGTRVLKYIAEIQVAAPTAERHQYDRPRIPKQFLDKPPVGLKQILDKKGPDGLRDHILDEKKLLITDTTMRDAHQSLFATRMRTRDMLLGAPGTAEILADCFSLEMWGGATFDVAYRFLHESPWERLELLREQIPNIPFQMLLRGSNLVGYANYPDNLVKAFVKQAATSGVDIFRVFDSLNWIPGMEVAMYEVLNENKFLEAAMCYTGDIMDEKRDKYTLKYYVDLAKQLEKMGAHAICIKDMSGLLKPYAAKKLISTLKGEVGLPIHLHTHDTTGNQVATLLMAAEAGVDVVDCAMSSMSSLTSQPSFDAVAAALADDVRDTGFDIRRLEELSDYWADVRLRYEPFDVGLKTPTTEIYRYEIPGGQYTNLRPQVVSLGLGSRFDEVKEMYKTVNDMLGDLVKVTPSSKVVGDLAIFMVQNELTPENIVEKGAGLSFPDSVVSYFKGMMGQPAWGFPEDIQKIVLKGEAPIICRPGELLEPVDFDKLRDEIAPMSSDELDMRSLISYAMYPKVYEDYLKHRKDYGYIMRMGSHVFFNGMALGETNKITIEEGKTLVIKYLGLGDSYDDGTREVRFEMNGSRREIRVRDPKVSSVVAQITMADQQDKSQIGASIPGMVSKVSVKVGDAVKENQVVAVVEAMKMETSVVAGMDGIIKEVLVEQGKVVKAGELMIRIGDK